jgi:AAA+ ATPase superfamily predicted ATPase
MKDPFQYGGIVEGSAFCNRKQELADLMAAFENSEKLFLYSERRLGKTSLVHTALRELPRGRYTSAYIDLWPTDGEMSFAAATARAITESMSSTAGQLLDMAKQLFSRLAPSVTADAEGKPKVTFGFNMTGQPGPEIEEVLAAPAKIAERGKRKVVIVFDEVQQVLEYESDLVERRLRSIVQKHKDVSYIFLGSRKHLIQKMFLDQSRPLYRAAGHYPLGSIATGHWIRFIARKFREGEKAIADGTIQGVCKLTEGHPFYTQHLCHALWELCEPGEAVTGALIETAMKILLDRESYAYTALWESLALNQKRLLKGFASEPAGVKPFAGTFVRRHGLGSASNSQRAVESLLKRDLIDRDNGSFLISDRFFRIWIGRRQVQ